MRVRRGTRRHFVGTTPQDRPVRFLSADRTVEEGLLIALTAVRMAVKNQIIMGVLRELRDYNADDYAEIAAGQFALLVAQNDDHTARFRASIAELNKSRNSRFGRAEVERLELLAEVHSRLAVELRTMGADTDQIMQIVETARQNAWQEIGEAWITKLTDELPAPLDADYERQRAGRLQELIYIDLAGLMELERPRLH